MSMVNRIKQEISMEESLKRKVDIICDFYNTPPKIINGSIRKVDKANLLSHWINLEHFLFYNFLV